MILKGVLLVSFFFFCLINNMLIYSDFCFCDFIFIFEREEERGHKVEMVGSWGDTGRSWGKGKHNQNIWYNLKK